MREFGNTEEKKAEGFTFNWKRKANYDIECLKINPINSVIRYEIENHNGIFKSFMTEIYGIREHTYLLGQYKSIDKAKEVVKEHYEWRLKQSKRLGGNNR